MPAQQNKGIERKLTKKFKPKIDQYSIWLIVSHQLGLICNLIQPESVSSPLCLRLHSSLIASTPLQAGCRLQVPLDTNRRNKQWIHMWEDSDSKPPQENIHKRISGHGNQTKALSPTYETITMTQKCSVRHLAGPEQQTRQCRAPGIAVGSVLTKVIGITWQKLLNFFFSQ